MANSTTVDHQALMNAFDGDRTLLAEAIGFFIEDYPPVLDDIRRSMSAADGDGLKRSAHALKGMLGNFGATEACLLADRLEAMGRNRSAENGSHLIADLADKIERIVQDLNRLTQDSCS